jgi:hypothetical protein
MDKDEKRGKNLMRRRKGFEKRNMKIVPAGSAEYKNRKERQVV